MKFSKVFSAPKRELNPNLYMHQFTRDGLEGLINPIIQIDYFYMAEPYFRPHPHSGFSAVTYMLDSSKGSFINRDSFGDRSEIKPGDIHWTWSASGIVHEEVPKIPGVVCNGLQIFVNMPERFREERPLVFHLESGLMPLASVAGGEIKVVVGEYAQRKSPLQLPTPMTILDLNLGLRSLAEIEVPGGFGGLLVRTSGEPLVHGCALGPHAAIGFANDGSQPERFSIGAQRSQARAILLMGEQVQDPLYFAGSLAAGSEASVQKAIARYQQGEMGSLTASF